MRYNLKMRGGVKESSRREDAVNAKILLGGK